MKIASPITNTKNTALIKETSTKVIIKYYKEKFDMDVSHLFEGVENLKLLKCKDSGFLFYYPYNIEGDSFFYENLSKKEWYYMDEKYEHKIIEKIINKEKYKKILEIGCGNGSFIKKMSSKNKEVTGLEINKNEISKDKKFKILDETIEDHSRDNKEKYDVVMSFQVLEHIKNPIDFIDHSLNTLKKGGLMIISVPNNDSFIKRKKDNFMNMPPHHMGKWNMESLLYISKIKNLVVENIILEPLQKYHINWYLTDNESNIYRKITQKIKNYFYKRVLKKIREDVIGHSIIFVYKKN
jgi:2-polyprenyl-3-methyl-5-hydroxy-6-metoxy-1,4-benzoquinol methylase